MQPGSELELRSRPLRVMMIAAEMAPFAKTGGLADVVGALPKALVEMGLEVKTFLPKYGLIDEQKFGLRTEFDELLVPMERWQEPGSVSSTDLGGVQVHFIASPRYFDRDGIYGYADDGERFVFASRGALEAVRLMGWRPDVIQCHDWHTGLAPNWLKTTLRDDGFFNGVGSLFTIHNLSYQGIFGQDILEIAGIARYGFIPSTQYPERSEILDFMARGIIFADKISTVSPRYAREILTPKYGERLDGFLRERQADLHGILNGIDLEIYNPATDPDLPVRFDASTFSRKLENKLALQIEAGLEKSSAAPLLGVVGRLTHQKGMDVLAQALPAILRQGAQFVLLGAGDPDLEEAFRRIAAERGAQAAAFTRFDPSLAQRIYGGADALLIPSRFEPCGLTQMIAMRYGTVPIVRATGGLADTVRDFGEDPDTGNGFTFDRLDALDLMACITRALETYRRPNDWRRLALRCMAQNFSWRPSAEAYAALYVKLLEDKRRAASIPHTVKTAGTGSES